MRKLVSILFGACCIGTSFVSGGLLEPGMWFWIILGTGVLVPATQFMPAIQSLGILVALLLGIIAVCAVALILLAATIGGSFKMDDRETLLLVFFALMALFGFVLTAINRREARHQGE